MNSLFSPAGPRWTQLALSLLRIVAAFLFILHGSQKLFGFPPTDRPFTGAPPLFTQFWFAGILETFGGALILLGLFTRPVALLLAGEMAVAYFQAHAPRDVLPIRNMGELAVLFCFVFLFLAAAGGGSLSLDAVIASRFVIGRRDRM